MYVSLALLLSPTPSAPVAQQLKSTTAIAVGRETGRLERPIFISGLLLLRGDRQIPSDNLALGIFAQNWGYSSRSPSNQFCPDPWSATRRPCWPP